MFLAHCNCSKFCINVEMANMHAKKHNHVLRIFVVWWYVRPVSPNPVRKVEIPELLISKVDKNAFSVIVNRETNKTLMVGCGQCCVSTNALFIHFEFGSKITNCFAK